MTTLTVITATYNAAEHLPTLIESLRAQSDQDFEWLIADGLSTDGTLELLSQINDLNITLSSEADFGIYDALNRGVTMSSGEFYLVMGADDYLYPDAIENYKKEISDDVDIVTASIKMKSGISRAGRGKSWVARQFEYVSGHSVGSIFRKSLHDRFGLYSRKFPIAADQLFIKVVCQNGAKVKVANFMAGKFNATGVSSTDVIGSMTESFRVQLLTEKNKPLQWALFIWHLIKHYKRICN
jgi:glycosyltransferase involved in cell wall biosynthesis